MPSFVSFGGVDESEISAISTELGVPGDAGASSTVRAIRRVAPLIAKTPVAQDGSAKHAVFLISESLSEYKDKCDYVEEPLLSHGLVSLHDKVFLSSPNLMSAFHLLLSWSSPGSLFAEIRIKGLGSVPAIVVSFTEGGHKANFYRSGLNNAADGEPITLFETGITRQELKETLDRFYELSLRTPTQVNNANANRIWESAGTGVPRDHPEEIIQGRLADMLRGAFPRHDTRGEQVLAEGRADLVISRRTRTENGELATVNDWTLELKALTDMTSSGNRVNSSIRPAVRKGLIQAISYKKLNNSQNAAVCCYDMRRADNGDDACFTPDFRGVAANRNIALWRWYLFRSAEQAREAHDYLDL